MHHRVHGPALGRGGGQRHGALVPVDVERLSPYGAEQLEEGLVSAGSRPVGTGFSFFQIYDGPRVLDLVFTNDLIFEGNIRVLLVRPAADRLVPLGWC